MQSPAVTGRAGGLAGGATVIEATEIRGARTLGECRIGGAPLPGRTGARILGSAARCAKADGVEARVVITAIEEGVSAKLVIRAPLLGFPIAEARADLSSWIRGVPADAKEPLFAITTSRAGVAFDAVAGVAFVSAYSLKMRGPTAEDQLEGANFVGATTCLRDGIADPLQISLEFLAGKILALTVRA
jgi:hypothetical protein